MGSEWTEIHPKQLVDKNANFVMEQVSMLWFLQSVHIAPGACSYLDTSIS